MAILYTQNFDALTVNTLPAGWAQVGAANWKVGLIRPFSPNNSFGEATFVSGNQCVYTGIAARTDMEIKYWQKVNRDGLGRGANVATVLRSSTDGLNQYLFLPAFDTGKLLVFKRVAGTFTQLNAAGGTASGTTFAIDDFAVVKAQVLGTTVRWRMWNSAFAEPGTWAETITDGAVTAAGYAGVYSGRNAGADAGTLSYCDDVTISSIDTGSTTIALTDLNLVFSPGNWFSDGAGSFQANNVKAASTYALSSTPGAYLKTVLTSASADGSIKLNVDTSKLNGITAANCPVVAYSIDGGAFSTSQLVYSASPTQVTLGTALSAASHTIDIVFRAVDLTSTSAMGDRWNNITTGFSGVRVTGVEIDSGSTLTMPVVRTKRAIWFGDSSLEGCQNLSSSLAVAGQDASYTYGLLGRFGLDAEIGIVGFSAQGYPQAGYGNVPALYNATVASAAWRNYHSGASRVAQPVDWIINSHGINGTTTAADVQAWITQVRAEYQSTAPWPHIFVVVPWTQDDATPIAAGVAAYKAAVPADAKVTLINAGINFSVPLYYNSGASTNHPSTRGDAVIAATLAPLIKAATAAVSGGGGIQSIGSSVIRGL